MPKLNLINCQSYGRTIKLIKANNYAVPKKPPLDNLKYEKISNMASSENQPVATFQSVSNFQQNVIKENPVIEQTIPTPENGIPVQHFKPLPDTVREIQLTSITPVETIITGIHAPKNNKEGSKIVEAKPLNSQHQKEDKGQTLGTSSKNSLKFLLVGGFIYYTCLLGIWSDTDASTMFVKRFMPTEVTGDKKKDEIVDGTVREVSYDHSVQAPNIDVTVYNMQETWNSGVKAVFSTMVGTADNLKDILKGIKGE